MTESPLNLEEIVWGSLYDKVPISLCYEDCLPGYVQVPLKKKCCWGCQQCNDYAVVTTIDNTTTCQNCPVTYWPNANFTQCLPIKHCFVDYRDIVYILSIAGSSFGLLLTALATYGLCVFADHSLVKASGIELCYINLVGLAFLCVAVITNLLQPNHVTCVVFEACISISFCVTFTPVLLKVNRIWRIFSLELGEQLRFASARSQYVISSVVIGTQVSNFPHLCLCG